MTSAYLARLLRGAAAGAVATVPMSAVMLGAGRLGLMGEQPPEAIAKTAVADATGDESHGAVSNALASLAHLGFGAVSGVLYAALPKPRRAAGPVAGVALALPIWAASYRGWVPAIGALPPADDDRRDRVAVMIGAHVVFGAVMGLLDQRWSKARSCGGCHRSRRPQPALLTPPRWTTSARGQSAHVDRPPRSAS